MSNKTNGKDLFIGALVGGVLGAVTALLLAPKSGRELRADISEQYGKISDKTVEIAGVVGTKTQEIAATVSSKTQDVATAVSGKTQEIAKTIGVQTGDFVGKAKDVAGAVTAEVKAWKDARKEAAAGVEGVTIEEVVEIEGSDTAEDKETEEVTK